jgi:hypothetical protein
MADKSTGLFSALAACFCTDGRLETETGSGPGKRSDSTLSWEESFESAYWVHRQQHCVSQRCGEKSEIKSERFAICLCCRAYHGAVTWSMATTSSLWSMRRQNRRPSSRKRKWRMEEKAVRDSRFKVRLLHRRQKEGQRPHGAALGLLEEPPHVWIGVAKPPMPKLHSEKGIAAMVWFG